MEPTRASDVSTNHSFGEDQLFWECRTVALAEDGHLFSHGKLREWLIEAHQVISSKEISSLQRHKCWAKLVEKYTSMTLTREKDKLPALSGIAKLFAARFEDKYLAGLWKETKTFRPWIEYQLY